jgi:hypothetical protein
MSSMSQRYRLHALVLDEPASTLEAVRALRNHGYVISDVHTPFPVHGLPEAMGLAPTRISRATLVGAVVGVSMGLGFQVWTHVASWPLNIGGKSNSALPALIPVTFELGILLAAFATVAGLLVWAGLAPLGRTPDTQPHERVTDDRFVVLVREEDASFDLKAFRNTTRALGIHEVIESWRVW